MTCARAAGACLLLWSATLPGQTVSIEITPQGPIRLASTAPDTSSAADLVTALAKSLGCAAGGSDIPTLSKGTFHMNCGGVLQRRGQVLDGQLKFAGFRQALTKASVNKISVDVAMPCGPYVRAAFPKSWDETCRDGVIHRSATIEPRELPSRPVRLVMGYRTLELAMIFGPLPVALLLSITLLAGLNYAAAKARDIDRRALWFAYVQAWSVGLTAIFVLWEAWWAGITGSLANRLDVWALYSEWNGGTAVNGRLMALGAYLATVLCVTVLSAYWSPAAFAALRDQQGRFIAVLKALTLPTLALIVPIMWILSAVGTLEKGQVGGFAMQLCSACGAALIAGAAMRSGRKRQTNTLERSEFRVRLIALARRCRAHMSDARIVPVRTGTIVEPLEAEDGRVALSDFALDVLEPPEIDAALVRRWSMPMSGYPWIRGVLVFLAALIAGALLSVVTLAVITIPLALLEGFLRVRTPLQLGRLALPLAIVLALPMYRIAEAWMLRGADRRAAVLLGDTEVVTRVAAKLSAAKSAPWKWSTTVLP